MNSNILGRHRQIVCSLVDINKSFGVYKNKAVDLKNVIICHNVYFCDQNVAFDQKWKWTDPGVNNNYSMSGSIYSVDNTCKRFGQNKLQQNISLV